MTNIFATAELERCKAYLDGPFAGLLSLAEFAQFHMVDDSAIRHAINRGTITKCQKFGKQWVLCEDAHRQYVTYSYGDAMRTAKRYAMERFREITGYDYI